MCMISINYGRKILLSNSFSIVSVIRSPKENSVVCNGTKMLLSSSFSATKLMTHKMLVIWNIDMTRFKYLITPDLHTRIWFYFCVLITYSWGLNDSNKRNSNLLDMSHCLFVEALIIHKLFERQRRDEANTFGQEHRTNFEVLPTTN